MEYSPEIKPPVSLVSVNIGEGYGTITRDGLLLVVPSPPAIDPWLGIREITQSMLPDSLFFEAPKKPFHEPILLRRVRGINS